MNEIRNQSLHQIKCLRKTTSGANIEKIRVLVEAYQCFRLLINQSSTGITNIHQIMVEGIGHCPHTQAPNNINLNKPNFEPFSTV